MKFTTPKTIRAELNRLGYKAHGRKCRVSIEGKETEAIIHCKDVPKDLTMRWFFCQDVKDGSDYYSGDKHGKKYSWSFWDDNEYEGIDWFEWVEEKDELDSLWEDTQSFIEEIKELRKENEELRTTIEGIKKLTNII